MYNFSMMKSFLLTILVIALSLNSSIAQESMMKDINYGLMDRIVNYAKENYPRIKANLHRIKMAEANITKAKLSYFDVVTFSYVHSPDNSTTLVNPTLLNGYQYGIFLNVGYLMQKPTLVKVAREERKALIDENMAYDQNIEMEVRKRYLLYVQGLSTLRSRMQALVDAESALKEVKYRFEKGEETFDNYNKALVVLEDHHQKRIESEGSMLIAKVELEELLGKKLEEFE
jgi:outer membrane protein TolC